MSIFSTFFSAWRVALTLAFLIAAPTAQASDAAAGASKFDAKDRQAVVNLISSYGPLYDSAQIAPWRTLFTDEPVFEFWQGDKKLVEGLPLFLAAAQKRHELFKEHKMQRRHFLTPRVITQDENSISGDAYLLLSSTTGGAPTVVATGLYEFTAVKQNGTWKLSRWVGRFDNAIN